MTQQSRYHPVYEASRRHIIEVIFTRLVDQELVTKQRNTAILSEDGTLHTVWISSS